MASENRATRKYRLMIAYDGTGYAGWQIQKIGLGVQQRVEEALARLFPSAPGVHGSSRTDTGVHALGLVAHFEVTRAEDRIPAVKLLLALNAHLPPDIRVMEVRRCAPRFHARFNATGKQYRYYVWNHRAMNPLLAHRAWQVPRPLDVRAMRAAAPRFLGRRDFKSLAATHSYPLESTVRTLWRCDLRQNGPLLTFILEGDGFLYKMCRGIVGTIVQVGEGKICGEDIDAILAQRDRRVAGMTAPAEGLVLCKVYYGKRRPAHIEGQGDDLSET